MTSGSNMNYTNKTKDDGAFNSTYLSRNYPNYTCFCSGRGCSNYSKNCTDAIRCLSSEFHDSGGYTFTRGCVTGTDWGKMNVLCHSSFFNSETDFYKIDCCKGNFCNNATSSYTNGIGVGGKVGIAFACLLGLALVSLMVWYCVRKLSYRKKFKYLPEMTAAGSFTPPANTYRDDLRATAAGDSTLREIFSESMTSGSGSGLPLFVQRTLAKNIHREDVIGRGRYGEVWRGIWQGDSVAVKIFFSQDEASWQRESDIYNNILLPHENILGFYGSDVTSVASCTQLWLVMHYHPNGSLFDYLKAYSLDYQELMQILVSTVSGILHLHTEISGVERKPPIAHRDLKTKNILVKKDGTCCIADFGLAVMRMPNSGEINIGTNPRVGTKRYMSPEVLNETINCDVFDNFRKVDMYCLALVMWECCQRCIVDGVAGDYQLPYGDIVPHDPSIEQMKKAICFDKRRPSIPERMTNDKVLNGVSELIKECWHHNPDVRLPAMRVKKNLMKIQDELQISY